MTSSRINFRHTIFEVQAEPDAIIAVAELNYLVVWVRRSLGVALGIRSTGAAECCSASDVGCGDGGRGSLAVRHDSGTSNHGWGGDCGVATPQGSDSGGTAA
jgi:hypothetical protein